jgi:predicted RecB family nuclease
LKEHRNHNQARYLDSFLQSHPDAKQYEAKGFNKYEFLLNATLKSAQLEAYCATLIKVNNDLENRRNSYEPTIVAGTYSITPEQKTELLFVGLVLEQIQKQLPAVGRIVTMDEKAHRVKLEKGYKGAKAYLKTLESWCSTQSNEAPALILNKHCPSCQFRDICREQAEKENNLSLLDRMTPKAIQTYNKRGIFTVQQLSYLFRPRRKQKKRKSPEPVKHSLELQALAIREQKIYIQEMPELVRQPVELFLDIEGIPDQDFYYLIGILICKGDNKSHYSFWADTIEDERKIWNQLIEKLNEYPETSIYHYGSYELNVINKLSKKFETNAEGIKQRLVNVNSYIYGKIYFPIFSNSLKEFGKFLNFSWASLDASGLQSIAWRYQWDISLDDNSKQKLIEYNRDDCYALKLGFRFLLGLANNVSKNNRCDIVYVDNIKAHSYNNFWKIEFVLNDFDHINKCAYFNYQRDKIFFRDKKEKLNSLNENNEKKKRSRQDHKINKLVEFPLPEKCIRCGHDNVGKRGKVHKTVIDLKLFKFGIKKWVTKFTAYRAWCKHCNYKWRPEEFKQIRNRYTHQTYAYIAYQRVALKQSQGDIYKGLTDIFGFHVLPKWEKSMVAMANYYQSTYEKILERINLGKLVHADETKVDLKDKTGYVWVFTSLEDVFYIYSSSREGEILHEVLANFNGVLVSDFYSAYNSVECLQQKCIIHLIRDMNDDLHVNPFDEKYKILTKEFGSLIKMIVETIDEHGLKKIYLERHVSDVNQFYKKIEALSSESEIFNKYKSRLTKNRVKLFEFLNHDNVPWNNNNAECAIKAFASYRNIADGRFTENGIDRYLLLLSIYQTCKYKDVSFLEFLFSEKTDIDDFRKNK